MVADSTGEHLLGYSYRRGRATELIHLGKWDCFTVCLSTDLLTTFSISRLAEAYRVAALDIVKQRQR